VEAVMKYLIFLLSALFTLNTYAQALQKTDSSDQQKAINYETSYTGDFTSNLSGGLKTGSVYLGMANIKIGLETENIGLWKGGEFFVSGVSTHGYTPSEKLIGDFQAASNIEAGNHTYLQELWYKHSFEQFEITIGLQDLNSEFITSEFAGTFLNSSFGIPSLISDNIPVPIFPLTALGVMGKFQLNKSLAFRAAIFDGCPESFEENPHNIEWCLNKDDGYQIFSEIELSTNFNKLPGTLKIGGYYHNHLNEINEETGNAETVFAKNYGFYFLADQTIWQKNGNPNLGVFIQIAISPSNINVHNYYFGGGINYSGIFVEEDVFGLAVAHAGLSNSLVGNETTFETFYKIGITENIFIQPDIQYIINPAGTENKLDNALAAFIRFAINF
jgi:porin